LCFFSFKSCPINSLLWLLHSLGSFQGYILDGYPKTVAQAKLLFEEGELETPEEGAADMDDEQAPTVPMAFNGCQWKKIDRWWVPPMAANEFFYQG
jgi:hypothetical protein